MAAPHILLHSRDEICLHLQNGVHLAKIIEDTPDVLKQKLEKYTVERNCFGLATYYWHLVPIIPVRLIRLPGLRSICISSHASLQLLIKSLKSIKRHAMQSHIKRLSFHDQPLILISR